MRKVFGKTVKVARPTKKVAKISKESPYKLEEPKKVVNLLIYCIVVGMIKL